MNSKTLSTKVSKAEKDLLRKTAAERKSSPSRLLRDALQIVLADGGSGQPTSLLDKHQHLFADLDQGTGDLYTNPEALKNYGK